MIMHFLGKFTFTFHKLCCYYLPTINLWAWKRAGGVCTTKSKIVNNTGSRRVRRPLTEDDIWQAGRHARIYIPSFKPAKGRLQKLVTCKQERYLQCIESINMILVILFVQPSLCVRACTCHMAKIFFWGDSLSRSRSTLGLIGPYWVRVLEGWTLCSTTLDNWLPQRSTLVLIGPYWVRLQEGWTLGNTTMDIRVPQRSNKLVLMGPYLVGEKKDRLKP